MKLKSAIMLLLISTMGYFGYGFVRTHTSGDVIAYKNFARAVMNNDQARASRVALGNDVLKVFEEQKERMARYRGHVKFTYHQILEQRFSEDGHSVYLRVRQVTRLDPFNTEKTLLGSRSIEEIHSVTMVQKNLVWRVQRFDERYMGSS